MIFYDTETCGLHGMAVLIQWAEDDGPVQLYSPWSSPISETLALIEYMMNHEGGIVGFNLAFDHFHLCKLYTIFSLYPDQDACPEDIIDKIALLEPLGRDGPCLKPHKVCDLMLHARKGPYQSTMDRSDIRIKKVPTALAWQLAEELEKRVELKDIYFARRKDKLRSKWQVYDRHDDEGTMDPNFKDIVLKFAASSALKALSADALNLPPDQVLLFSDVELDKSSWPTEVGFAPYALALGNVQDWKNTWPEVIHRHISHWNYNARAREYAEKDVVLTRALYRHFGSPELGDDDSELACMVAAVRWKGFKVDIPRLKELREKAIKRKSEYPTAPGPVKHYIMEPMDETEKLTHKGSTKAVILEAMTKLTNPCPKCNRDADTSFTEQEIHQEILSEFDVDQELIKIDIDTSKANLNCDECRGTGVIRHPSAIRAENVLSARKAQKQIELYDKLIKAGRFHASSSVIGTLSSRMSGGGSAKGIERSGSAGGDKLNPQGINKAKETRECFPLAFDDMVLCGGDFSGFEVCLAEACYEDEKLRRDLLTCESCEGQMVRVGEKVLAKDFLSPEAFKKYKGKSDYFYNDFICTSCGSNKGKKIHALFGVHVFPNMTYEQIKASEGSADDKYTKCKQAIFAMFYGGEGPTLQDRLGVDLDTANKAFQEFTRRYPGVGKARKLVIDLFCSMRQPDGIGTRVQWHEPAQYIESMFGFRRYFQLENSICKALFQLANSPPKAWAAIRVKVQRRERIQSAAGAVQSSLYAAAFALQAANTRAAANHVIQSSGATITKAVQRRIWDVQTPGISKWLVVPMNVHDEIETPCDPSVVEKVKQNVNEVVESFRPKVPLIKMDWSIGLKSWAEKG